MLQFSCTMYIQMYCPLNFLTFWFDQRQFHIKHGTLYLLQMYLPLMCEMYDVAVFFKALFGFDAFEYFIYMYWYFAFQTLGLLHSYLMFYSENIYDHFNQDSVHYYLFLIITYFEWKSKNSSRDILLCFPSIYIIAHLLFVF